MPDQIKGKYQYDELTRADQILFRYVEAEVQAINNHIEHIDRQIRDLGFARREAIRKLKMAQGLMGSIVKNEFQKHTFSQELREHVQNHLEPNQISDMFEHLRESEEEKNSGK